MTDFIDYYEVLQIQPSAEQEVVDKAYKALIFKYHPDRGGDEERAKQITGAYWVVSDPQRRSDYDRERSASYGGSTPSPSGPRYATYDDIPDEIVDAILARDWLDGAAATVRTAGRVVGAAASIGLTVATAAALEGAAPALEAHQKRRAAKLHAWDENQRATADEEVRMQRQMQADDDATGWIPRPSASALQAHENLQKRKKSEYFADLEPYELVWLAARHPTPSVRREAFSRAATFFPNADLFAGQEDVHSAPVVLLAASDVRGVGRQDFATRMSGIASARFVSSVELEAWTRQSTDTRRRGGVTGALWLGVAVVLAVLAVFAKMRGWI